MECSSVSIQETRIHASLSVENLTLTRNNIQWACNNRTTQLSADIAAFTPSASSNATIVQSGTLLVTVQGAGFNVPSSYTWKRILVGGEFKLDVLILNPWNFAAPISTPIINATIAFHTFSPLLCLYQNPLPVFLPPFMGATVTTVEGLCGTIVFNTVGGISDVKLIKDYGIFF